MPFLAWAACAAWGAGGAEAQSLGVSITPASTLTLLLDANKPCMEGPRGAYLAFRVTNTSGAAVTDAWATLAGFGSGVSLGGGQPAAQYVGRLGAGESRTLFWFVDPGCTLGVSTTLSLTVTSGAGGSASAPFTVNVGEAISANAGGFLSSDVLGPGAVPGQVIPYDVTYEFGGSQAGTDYNVQPAGTQSFDARCFQLVGSEVTASTVDAIPVGARDVLRFTSTSKQPGNGYTATVRYYFKFLCAGATTSPRPYAMMVSGTSMKYSGNFEAYTGTSFPAPTPASTAFQVTKSVSPATLPGGGTATFTVSIANTSAWDAAIDSIVDVLPAGMKYAGLVSGSGVTAANSGAVPADSASGTIRWRGIPGTSYSLPAGGTLTLVYRVAVPDTAAVYVNSVTAYAGLDATTPASASLRAGPIADLAVAKSGPASVTVGDTVRYAISTSNAGPSAAADVVVTDTLPAKLTFVSATRGGTLSGNVVSWPSVASLASGATLADTVTVVVADSGSFVNVAAATSSTYDPDPANDDGSGAGRVAITASARYAVSVTPDGLAQPARRLPGGPYSRVFTVASGASVADDYDLLVSTTGTALVAVDSVRATGLAATARPDSFRVSLAAGASLDVTVWYSVAAGDSADATLRLRARSAAVAAADDEGWVEVRRVRPALTLAKSVSPQTGVGPGVELTYTLDFANAGGYDAEAVVLADDVPPEVAFRVGSEQSSLPGGITAAVAFSSDGGATWTYLPVSGGCGAPAGYDACVRALRWSLSGSLPPDSGGAGVQGSAGFVAVVR